MAVAELGYCLGLAPEAWAGPGCGYCLRLVPVARRWPSLRCTGASAGRSGAPWRCAGRTVRVVAAEEVHDRRDLAQVIVVVVGRDGRRLAGGERVQRPVAVALRERRGRGTPLRKWRW
jgi:hypothetical protein